MCILNYFVIEAEATLDVYINPRILIVIYSSPIQMELLRLNIRIKITNFITVFYL